jgi:alpha-tubulin suppressor-like RCC1 family protein
LNISGTNFIAGATTVTFNNISGSNVSVTDSQHLSVIVPNLGSSNLSNVAVLVTNSGGSATNTGFNYSASAVPVVYHPMVTAGISHTAGLKAGGTVFATGDNRFGQCNVGSWTGITQIAAGGYFTVGLKADGTVVATGDDRFGQCDLSSWSGITQIATGFDNTIGLKSDGTVVAAGDDYFGQCDVSSWKGSLKSHPGIFTQ